MVQQQGRQGQTIDRLEKFRKYKATISLSGVESFAHNLMIQAKLMEAGFTNVTVQGSGCSRTATGVWSRETQAMPDLPRQVTEVKEL